MRAIVGAIVGIMISFIVGLVVVGALISNTPRGGWSAQANATWTSLVTNIWTAFAIMVIIPLVVAAVALLSIFSGGGRGGGAGV